MMEYGDIYETGREEEKNESRTSQRRMSATERWGNDELRKV
jgi:hypothetical protein